MTKVTFESPFIDMKGNIAYAKSGDIILCYRIRLVETYSMGGDDLDELFTQWYMGLKHMPDNVILVKQDVVLKRYFDTTDFPETNFLQKADKEFFNGKEFAKHESYVFFVFSQAEALFKNPSIYNPFKPLPSPKSVKADNDKFIRFKREIEHTVEFLNSYQVLKLSVLQENEIAQYTRQYFNAFYSDRNTDSIKEKKHYRIGNKLVGSFVIRNRKQLPEVVKNRVVDSKMSSPDYKFYRSFADCLNLDLPFDHVYTQIICVQNHKDEIAKIEEKKKVFEGTVGFNTSNGTAAKKIGEFLDSQNDESMLVRCHFNVTFFAETEEEFKSHEAEISKTFKRMDIVPYFPTGNNLMNIFNNTFFAFVSRLDIENSFILDLKEAICFIANTTNYESDEEGLWFYDRLFNTPIKKDTWDAKKKRIKARNFLIVTETGGGKSVLFNHMVRQYYEQGYKIVINDMGRSYEKTILLFPEEEILYIRYQEGKPLGINPFYLPAGLKLTATHSDQIVSFIELLWKRELKLDNEEEVSLLKINKAYYDVVTSDHSFPSYYKFVKANKDALMEELEIEYQHFRIDEFLHNCSVFVDDNTYSFLFNNSEKFNYDLSTIRVVLFEFDEAQQNPLMLSILLLLSSEITRRLCWLDLTTRSIVMFEEFAKMLEYPTVLKGVKLYTQAARKQECAIGLVLQNVAQLPDNDIAKSILANIQVVFVLESDKGYSGIREKFNMPLHVEDMMKSIKSNFTGKYKYSEFLLWLGNQGNVLRLHLPPDNLLAFMTEGAENSKIMQMHEQTKHMGAPKAMEEAIRLYKQKYLNA